MEMENLYEKWQETQSKEEARILALPMPAAIETAKKADINEIVITFAGYGDSGCIESFEFYGPNHKGKFPELPENEQEELHAWADEISMLAPDWYNNDGGGGCITIYPQSLEYTLTAYQNETVSYDTINLTRSWKD